MCFKVACASKYRALQNNILNLQTFTEVGITIWRIFQTILLAPLMHISTIRMGRHRNANLASDNQLSAIFRRFFKIIGNENSVGCGNSWQLNIGRMLDIANNFDIRTVSEHFLVTTTNGSGTVGTNSPSISRSILILAINFLSSCFNRLVATSFLSVLIKSYSQVTRLLLYRRN